MFQPQRCALERQGDHNHGSHHKIARNGEDDPRAQQWGVSRIKSLFQKPVVGIFSVTKILWHKSSWQLLLPPPPGLLARVLEGRAKSCPSA